MAKLEEVWVSALHKKPVHLIDRGYTVRNKDGEPDLLRIDIDKRMAEEEIPILVPKTSFMQGMYSDPLNVLRMWTDVNAARKKHDEFFKNIDGEQKADGAAKKELAKGKELAMKKATEIFEAEMKKLEEKTDKRPRVVRKADKVEK